MGTESAADRVPQLDALRGIAIGLVLVHHYLQWSWGIFSGRTGVILFFILSGYFITGILIRFRARVESGESTRGAALKAFYLRRAFRILPAFYLMLLGAYALGVPDVREYFGWHAAYLSNILFAIRGDWLPYTAHLWSLAVEEQFYLVWPLVVWWTPRRWLPGVIAATILLAPLSRVAIHALGLPAIASLTLPFCVTDALGLGALLACMCAPEYRHAARAIRGFVQAAAVGALALYCLLFAAGRAETLWETLVAFSLGAIVLGAIERRTAGIWQALAWKPLATLGRISYGVYLFHLPVTYVVWLATSALFPDTAELPRSVLVPVWTACTLALATLSWHFMERPILSLTPSHARPRAVTSS